MRYLLFILLISLIGCESITAQKESESAKEDREFKALISKVEENTQASAKVQEEASKRQQAIVKETIIKIVTLKEENKDLITELNEVKIKLDSASADTIMPFQLLPIPRKKNI